MKKQRVQYPNFDKIIVDCKEKIKSKFPEYGNSWQDTGLIFTDFWEKRLKQEIKEIFENHDKFDNNKFQSMKGEIIDAINVLAMMYEHADIEATEEHEIYKRTWRYG